MFLSRQSSSSYSGYGIPYPPRNPAPLRPPRYPGPYAQPPQPSYGAPPLSSVRFYGRSFSWTPTGGAQSSRISGVYEPDGGLLSRRGGYDEGRDPRGDHHEDRNPFPSSGRPPSPRRGSTQPYSDDDFGRSGAHHDPHLSGGPNHSHSHHRRSGPRSHSVPPSVFSERERRPYGGLLESAPRGQSASRGRNMRSDGYDDPPPPKVRKTSKWRTLGNQRARTSSPPAIKTENLRPDAYDGGPRAPNVRETSRWRSFGRSRPSPQPPLPTIRGREMGSDRYNDGRHQTYPNGKRRHFGFRRSPAPRASPPAQSKSSSRQQGAQILADIQMQVQCRARARTAPSTSSRVSSTRSAAD